MKVGVEVAVKRPMPAFGCTSSRFSAQLDFVQCSDHVLKHFYTSSGQLPDYDPKGSDQAL